MAKRKSTDKTSKTETDEKVDTQDVSDAAGTPASEADATELADVAVETGESTVEDISSDDTVVADAMDDPVELNEPIDDIETSETAEVTDVPEDEDMSQDVDASQYAHLSEEEAERLIEEAETAEASSKPADILGSEFAGTEAVPVAPEVIRETVVERKGGFAPMLLGGVVAAGLGYGTAAYVSQDLWPFATASDDGFETDMRAFENEMRETVEAQGGSMTELTDRVATLEGIEPPTFDPTPIQSDLASVRDSVDGVSARLDDIAARVDTLERQPMEQAVSPEAIAAYERALADLQAEVEAQRAEVEQMAQEALQAEGNAQEQSQLAASRAALAELTTALDSGAGYADAVGVLSGNGVDVPEVLMANSETGIATQSALVEAFPNVARDALAAARSEATDTAGGGNRIATFFANQLGARSVAPKEGDDPDAILSRAEASVRSGDLDTALTELSALPEVAQAAIADWQTSASTRLEATSAADVLVQQLLQN